MPAKGGSPARLMVRTAESFHLWARPKKAIRRLKHYIAWKVCRNVPMEHLTLGSP